MDVEQEMGRMGIREWKRKAQERDEEKNCGGQGRQRAVEPARTIC